MGHILFGSDSEILQIATEAFRRGDVLLHPTATVYGIGGNPMDRVLSARIHAIKGTPANKPHLLLTDAWRRVEPWLATPSGMYRRLMTAADEFPVTILFDAASGAHGAPPHLIGDSGHIAVRKTGHSFCRRLIASAGSVMISTSANRTGKLPPATFDEIDSDILEEADIAVKGAAGSGISSTIVTVENGRVVVVRRGGTSLETIMNRLEQTKA